MIGGPFTPKDAPPPTRLVCGVDPGLSGAIAFYDPIAKRLESVHDMPTGPHPANPKKKIISLPALGMLIDAYASRIEFAVVEEVGARPGQGVTSMFRFGYAAGAVAGALSTAGIPVKYVQPAVWKILMGVTHDKGTSIRKAKSIFPLSPYFERAKDDGRAEAALLAFFGAERLFKK